MAVIDQTDPRQLGSEIQARGSWGGKFEFMLTCVGTAIGLGNVWRFPYLCYMNGGGAFLLPYIIMLIIVGMPMYYIELSLGQFSSLGPIKAWSISPLFQGIGASMIAIAWLFSLYYIVIVAWAFYFFFSSFTSKLPWTDCNNIWNTILCVQTSEMRELQDNETALNLTLIAKNISSTEELKTPSEEYFYNKVLQLSSGLGEAGPPVWELALCLLLAWLIVFTVLIKGIESLGKVVYFSSIFPYVMMTVLVIRGATLDGALDGVVYYLNPRPEKLADPFVWAEAATMVFFSMGLCSGQLIAMSSYNDFHHNFYKAALILPTIVGLTSLYSGFAIFTVLGFMSKTKGVDIEKVAAQGPGLVFVVYPEALTQMPLPPLWSVLFFLMLLTLGISSEFTWVEAPFVSIMDAWPHIFRVNKTRPVILRAIFMSCYYLITLPMVTPGGFYLFSLTDNFVGGFPMLFIGLLELIVICLIYGYSQYYDDINIMLGKPPPILLKICWLIIAPLILAVCIILKCVLYKPYKLENYVYPAWGQVLGWMQVAFVLMWIPLWMLIVTCKNSNIGRVLRIMSQPTESWGPAIPSNRLGTRYDPENRLLNEQDKYETPLSIISSEGIAESENDLYSNIEKTPDGFILNKLTKRNVLEHKEGYDNECFSSF